MGELHSSLFIGKTCRLSPRNFSCSSSGLERPKLVEFRFRHKDGSWRDFEAIGRAIRDPDGRCSMIGNARDITERKRAEAMLRASQEKLRQALRRPVLDLGLEHGNERGGLLR